MKKTIFFISFAFAVLFANAQQPKLEWAKQLGSKTGAMNPSEVVSDSYGNIYTTGNFVGTADFDPNAGNFNLSAGNNGGDVFISKLDASGNFVWAKSLFSLVTNYVRNVGYSVAIDKSGNVYITGCFENTVDFDPGKDTFKLSAVGGYDIFILKLDASGNFVWAKNMGGFSDESGYSIKVDESGNCYTTGFFESTVDFDPGTGTFNLTSNVKRDIFISKLNSFGNFVWAKKLNTSISTDQVNSIALDRSGNLYLTGGFIDSIDFNPGKTSKIFTKVKGGGDVFIAKYTLTGNFIWAKTMGGNYYKSYGRSLEIDEFGNTYTMGTFYGTFDFDPNAGQFLLTAAGTTNQNDIFILKLNASGNFVWAKQIGSFDVDQIGSMSLDSRANVYITGSFDNTADFDPGIGTFELKTKGGWDIFISKLNSSGNFVWATGFGAYSSDWGSSVVADKFGNVYSIGTFHGKVDFDPDTAQLILSDLNGMMFISKMSQDSCDYMALVIDSLRNRSCSDSIGYSSAYAENGKTPYKYFWNTVPSIEDSIGKFKTQGIYSITVTDANKCQKKTSILINGPAINSGFDLNESFISEPFRPGRKSKLIPLGLNERCTPVNGMFSIVLNKLVSYDKASPLPDKISGDTLIWNFNNLTFESKQIKPEIYIITSTKAMTNDSVCFDLIIAPPELDANPNNNKKKYCYRVNNSHDPNIKTIYPQGACEQNYVLKDKPLTYTVQFQNTGNAEAIDIYILDTLDKNLDINTLRVIGQSHKPPVTEILSGDVIKFRFDNINLADSFNNEKASHGYVIFEVMPKNAVTNGTIVKGKAGIYFDFNPPVFTNEVMNTLTSSIPPCNVGIDNRTYLKAVHIYPNPNTGSFTIEIDNPEKDISIEVYTLLGEKIETIETAPSQSHYAVDLNTANGIYLVKIKNGGMVYNQKVSITK